MIFAKWMKIEDKELAAELDAEFDRPHLNRFAFANLLVRFMKSCAPMFAIDDFFIFMRSLIALKGLALHGPFDSLNMFTSIIKHRRIREDGWTADPFEVVDTQSLYFFLTPRVFQRGYIDSLDDVYSDQLFCQFYIYIAFDKEEVWTLSRSLREYLEAQFLGSECYEPIVEMDEEDQERLEATMEKDMEAAFTPVAKLIERKNNAN